MRVFSPPIRGERISQLIGPQAQKLDRILCAAAKAVAKDLFHQRQAGEHAGCFASEPEGITTIDAPDAGGFWVVLAHDADGAAPRLAATPNPCDHPFSH